MNTVSSIERQQPDGLLSKVPAERLLEYGKVGHFVRDSVVCNGDQLGECAYLVLKGKCELRRKSTDAGNRVIQVFETGGTFGGLIDGMPERLSTEVVATQESVVLAVRMEDLPSLERQPNGEQPPVRETETSSNTTFFFNAPISRTDSFVFISDSLHASNLSESIARHLRMETNESVLLLEFATATATRSVTTPEHNLDNSATLPRDIFRDESGLPRLRLKLVGELPAPEVIGDLLRKLHRRFRYVVVSVPAEQIPASYLYTCIAQSNAAHFFLRPNADDLYRLDLLLHELRRRMNQVSPVELKPVICLAPNETIGNFDQQIINIGMASPEVIHNRPISPQPDEPASSKPVQRSFYSDVRRVARGIAGNLVGLALSSGGAKGFAHIGVIQVLEENGLDVDVVAGASMGAYVGSIWAYGHDGTKLEELAREMEVKWAMWSLLDPVVIPWQGFLRGYAVKRRLQRSIGEAQFGDLTRTFRVVAAHLDTMERKVFSTGEVAMAVHASIAVPGICIPVRIGEEVYVDGGIVDPVPTDVLQEMGIRKIIAVNTIPTPDRIRYCLQSERELARLHPKKSRSLIRKLLPSNLYMNHYTDSNVLEILMHSTHGAQMRVAEASSRRADIVLHPDICDDRWMDFRNPGLYVKAGREVALRHLDEIKSLIQEKGARHEHEQAPKTLANIG
jgi:NTE family protein